MRTALLNSSMHDGSRHFAELPETCSWDEFHTHIAQLPGVTITEYVTDNVTEMWLDFSFRSHAFTVNNQYGDFLLFVGDPACPDDILTGVVEHCEALLSVRRT